MMRSCRALGSERSNSVRRCASTMCTDASFIPSVAACRDYGSTGILPPSFTNTARRIIVAEELEAKFGLPEHVQYCVRCVMSNQRPASSVEFKHGKQHRHRTLRFDEQGVCDACRVAERKKDIDW